MSFLEKYIRKVRENKVNAAKGSLVVAVIVFIVFFIVNKVSGQELVYSFFMALALGVIFWGIFFVFSLNLVKTEDKANERKEAEKQREREERREKLTTKTKINNKKKKKYREK